MEKKDNTINEKRKKQILELMATPGVEIRDIAKKTGLKYEKLMKVLEDEYMKHNLDYGRRLCCRY
ncbi:MAG: hypothetical protein ACOC44_00340 [Promethearchaeia archaeon]